MFTLVRLVRRLTLGFLGLAAIAPACTAMAACSRIELAAAGPYLVGTRSVSVVRANNSTFTARLYYPATGATTNAPLDPAGAPYPAVTFGHGFLQSVTSYTSTLQHLASRGFIVVASESEGGLFPNHANFALDLRQCLTWLEQQSVASGSFLFGGVNTNAFGAGGHSMGGGASILAAASDARIKALAPCAPANTNPSAIAAAASITAPTCIIAGDEDSIVPTSSNGQLMFSALAGPRQLAALDGGFHCGFQDSSGFGCDGGSMPRATQLQLTRGLLTAFFDLHLKGDQSRWSCVWGPDAFTDPLVVMQSDSRFGLSALPSSAQGAIGAQVPVTLTIANSTGGTLRSFVLQAENSEWAAAFDPPTTPAIAPGATGNAQMSVTISAAGPNMQTLVVSAAASNGARAFASVSLQRLCAADIAPPGSPNGAVDVSDLLAVIGAWGATGPSTADINSDGIVDVTDLLAVIGAWGACP